MTFLDYIKTSKKWIQFGQLDKIKKIERENKNPGIK